MNWVMTKWRTERALCVVIICLTAALGLMTVVTGILVIATIVRHSKAEGKSEELSNDTTKMTAAQIKEKTKGKTKDEVMKILGRPSSTFGDLESDWLYHCYNPTTDKEDFAHVIFVDGKATGK